jgi:transposase
VSRVVVAGCDPHLDSIAVGVIDGVGAELGAVTVPNSGLGWAEVAGLCARYGVSRVGVEAASGYGRRLAQYLLGEGVVVVEVPTRLTASERRREGEAKTDPGDARAVARAVARGEGSVWSDEAVLERIRLLTHRREGLVRAQTRDINRLRALLVEVDPSRAAGMRRLRSRRQFIALGRVRYRGDTHRQTVGMLIRQLAGDCVRRYDQIRGLHAQMRESLPPAGKALMTIPGLGLISTCQLLAELAGTDGFATDAKMAAWAGVAPLDASSGRQLRHRLNRGGNRQANRAIHTIAITQLRRGGPAAEYKARKTSQGKTDKEAIRALKRHIIRRVWKTLRTHGLT